MRRRGVALRLIPNQLHLPRIPRFLRGAFRDRHGRWAREAMDASGAKDECAVTRTAKSCGPDASTLAFKLSTMLRIATATVTRSPITGESTKETVKTTRAGNAGMFGEPVVTNSCAFYFLHARLRVRSSIRHSLCPLFFEGGYLQ